MVAVRAALVVSLLTSACGSSPVSLTEPPGATDSGIAVPDGAPSGGADASTGETPGTADGGDSGSPVVIADAALLGDAGFPRSFTVTNQCAQPVWADALPATTFPGGLVEMAPGYSFQVGVDNGWSGRIWGKTGCTTTGSKTTCQSDPFPASLAELTLTKTATGLDFYDVSLVDGFNLPIALDAVGHTPDPAHPYDCGSPTCAQDLDTTCAQQFQDSVSGQVVACANDACKVVGNNSPTAPACIYPNQYTEFFKTACPQAYSYPSDDKTSTFTCKGYNDYAVVFCP
jgi:hypothetical protein